MIELTFLHTKHLKMTIWISVLWKVFMAIFETLSFKKKILPKLKNSLVKKICDVCHRCFYNWDLNTFSPSKWPSASKFCGIYSWSWQKRWPEMIVKWPNTKVVLFISNQSLHTINIYGTYLEMYNKFWTLRNSFFYYL